MTWSDFFGGLWAPLLLAACSQGTPRVVAAPSAPPVARPETSAVDSPPSSVSAASPCDAAPLEIDMGMAPVVPTLACEEDEQRSRVRGEHEYYCEDGAGRPSGLAVQRYGSGELAAFGTLDGGERDGEWVFYGRSGREMMRITYEDGDPRAATWRWLGRSERCPDGTVPHKSIPVNDSPGVTLECCEQLLHDTVTNTLELRGCNGPRREWHPSGLEKCELESVDELPHGRMRCWWPNGHLAVQGDWDAGVRAGVWHHCSEGGGQHVVVTYDERGMPDRRIREPSY